MVLHSLAHLETIYSTLISTIITISLIVLFLKVSQNCKELITEGVLQIIVIDDYEVQDTILEG